MRRETDLIDVWFDSRAMPYAQIHYRFRKQELLDSKEVYPADFIAEEWIRHADGSSRCMPHSRDGV